MTDVITRRGFLVSTTGVLTAAAIHRYTKHFELTGEPLIEPPEKWQLTLYVIKDWGYQMWLGEPPETFDSEDERYQEGGEYDDHHPVTWAFRKLSDFDLGHEWEDDDGYSAEPCVNLIEGDRPGSNYTAAHLSDPLAASLLQARLRDLGENIQVKLINSRDSD